MSRSRGGRSVTTRSAIRISPAVSSSRPAIILRAVLLPQPEGPTSTRNSPSSTWSVRSLTATVPSGNCFVTPSRVMLATPVLLYVRLSVTGFGASGADDERVAGAYDTGDRERLLL